MTETEIAEMAWADEADLADELADALEAEQALNAELLAALRNVQKLISEAAMTGFNWQDGDWPERLFLSQQVTSSAIAKATQS